MSTAHLERLTLDRLGRLAGGQLAHDLDAALAAALQDIRRRAGARRARRVTVALSITPTGGGGKAIVRAAVKTGLPGDSSSQAVADFGPHDPALLFNPVSGTHLDQQPLPFDAPAPEAPPAFATQKPVKPAKKRKGA